MADGKIYITISDSRNGSGGGVGEEKQEKENKESALAKYAKHRFFNFIESQAKQAVNYTVNNIGNFTGNYQAQADAQTALGVLGFIVNLGTSIFAGAKMAGPWGAAIAGTIAIGSEAINIGYQYHTESFQNKKANRNIEMMRKRLGLEGLTDGSRTGGY